MDPVGIVIFAIFALLVIAAIVLPKLQRNRARVPEDQRERLHKINLPDHITEIYSVYRTHS